MKILFFANVFNAGCTFAISSMAAILLDQRDFAAFAYATAFTISTATILDLGLPLTLVKLFHERDRETFVLRVGIIMRAWVALLFIITAILAPPPLLNLLGFFEGDEVLGRMALCVSGFMGIWTVGRAYHQAHDNWNGMALLTGYYGILRLFSLCIVPFVSLDTKTLYLILTGLPAAICASSVAKLATSQQWLESIRYAGGLTGTFWGYTRWVALGMIFFQGYCIAPAWYSAHFLEPNELAKFLLATTFAGVASLFVATLRSRLLAEAAKIQNLAQWNSYLVSARHALPKLLLAGAAALVLAGATVHLIFDPKYSGIGLVTVTLILSFLLPGGIGYYSVLIHTLSRPQDEAFFHVGRLATLSAVYVLLKPVSAIELSIIQVSVSSVFECGQAARAVCLKKRIIT